MLKGERAWNQYQAEELGEFIKNTKEQRKKIKKIEIDKIIKWKNWQQKRKYDKSECLRKT